MHDELAAAAAAAPVVVPIEAVTPAASAPTDLSRFSEPASDSDVCACRTDSSASSGHADFCPLSLPPFYRSLLSKLLLYVSFADGCLRHLNIPVDLTAFPLLTASFDACSMKLAGLLSDVEFAFHSFLYVQLRRVLLRGFGFDPLKEESSAPETDAASSAGAKKLSESWASFAALLKSTPLPDANQATEERSIESDDITIPLSQCLCSLPPQSVQSQVLSSLPGRGHLPEASRVFSPVQTNDATSQMPAESSLADFLIGDRGDSYSPAARFQLGPFTRPSQHGLTTKDGCEDLNADGEGYVPLALGVVPPLTSMQLSCRSAPCLIWPEDRGDLSAIETLRLQALYSLDAFALKFYKYGDVQCSQYGEHLFPLSALSDQIANLRGWLVGSKAKSGFRISDRSKSGCDGAEEEEEDMTPRASKDSVRVSCETQTSPERQIEVGEEGSPAPEESASTPPAFAEPTNEIFLRRLLNVRDTEVLYLLTHLPEAQALAESGSMNSLPSADYVEAQLRMFAHWDLVSPVDAKCLPIHRVKTTMPTSPERPKLTESPAQTDSDKLPSSILEDVRK
ncbi:unnamed protein product, partial [Dibothriocephalus latus]